ncbi:uncharacterized protein LOC115627482 [Scaptodrosophila lebanonensis]|uniref:Uncharacterized protein LOC115627482 n=1 Tax=Drosophila lebanonensis TaxID=7225 RepID=A0A6J2TQS3_DROLE|nr:uncharacterized protein LOC115627482 [Scaptodrosophila lebanonensis]
MGIKTFQKKLDEFIRRNDIAPWYQALSPAQETIFHRLSNDLRDDFEQGTSYRVQKCLVCLGLSPVINTKKIRSMVQLSRGNDLAFLFFILEAYYKTYAKDHSYSFNEKILMTGLAELDMKPTLRELDRILPPGVPETYATAKVQWAISKVESGAFSNVGSRSKDKLPSKPNNQNQEDGPKILPYFQKQPRPIQRHLDLTYRPKKFTVTLPFWEVGKPPDYGPYTPAPWFASYELKPAVRVIKHAVDDAVTKVCEKQAEVENKENAESDQDPKEDSEEEPRNLCAYHRFLKEQMALLQDELTVKARDRCLEMIDIEHISRKMRCRRIVSQLDHDIDLYVEKYNKIVKSENTTLLTIVGTECNVCRAYVPTPIQNKEEKSLVGDCMGVAHTNVLQTYKGKRLTGGGLRIADIDFEGDLEPCKKGTLPEPTNCPEEREELPKKGHVEGTRISFSTDYKKANIDVRYTAKQTKKTFFKAAEKHKPYQFKYKRVFKTGRQEVNDLGKHIKKSFVRALNKSDDDELLQSICVDNKPKDNDQLAEGDGELELEVVDICRSKLTDSTGSTNETSDHSKYSHVDHRIPIIDAVVQCAVKIWKKRVEIKRAEMEYNEQNEFRDSTILTYDDIDKFDPDDIKLMDRLLKDGMNELKKNKRFVLAMLPFSHKLPILREWVKRRYGKRYSQKELDAHMKISEQIFEIVMSLQTSPPDVDLLEMEDTEQSFKDYKKMLEMAENVKTKYYEIINSTFFKHSNFCWYAMGAYLCPGGPPRSTFYSYMPATPRNLHRHHVWNGEYRNYRQLRDMVRSRKNGEQAQ